LICQNLEMIISAAYLCYNVGFSSWWWTSKLHNGLHCNSIRISCSYHALCTCCNTPEAIYLLIKFAHNPFCLLNLEIMKFHVTLL